jgi:hypothetical protein
MESNEHDRELKIKKTDTESLTDNLTDIASTWNDSQEKLLKSIAERSNCMRWLHTQCNQHFDNLNFYFTIPNVVISTLNGSITMSLSSLFPDPSVQKSATTVIGLVSIFSAILITMNQYVKSQQMMEAHRSSALAYGKLHRMVMNELSIPRDQRSHGFEFLKQVRLEIDRLENTSPSIIPSIIRKFNIQFADRNIEKPEIAGDLDEVEINTTIHRKEMNNGSPIYRPHKLLNDVSGGFLNKISSFYKSKTKKASEMKLDESDNILVMMGEAPTTSVPIPERKEN